MIKRLTLLVLFVTLLPGNYLHSQAKAEIKMMFYEAESWILFEDFREALPTYQRLLQFYPTNSNYKYRIGQCYLNIPGEKDKAISFLEEVVKDINPKYKEGKFKEKGAPYDALYYLANAYRIDNQLDKAIETYELFKKDIDTKIYKPEVVEEQIQSCYNAKKLMIAPLYVKEQNLGSNINENNSEFNPVISDDEKIMIYSKTEAFYDAILYSTRNNGEWSVPINMNEALRVDRDLYPTSISKDGKTLYLYSSAGYDGIIYSSTYENGSWNPIVKLNDNINTKYWESHAAISHDNKKLYFTSNRKNSIGGLDIYVSSRDSLGNWGPAVNLGPVINTEYHENTPFLSKDDKTLFFSSRGHFNIGGYDILYSTQLDSGKWSVPLNVGYPLNSTDDDVFFKPINEGYQGYLAKYSPDGFGSQDIYRIEIFSDEHPRKFTIRGIAKIADLINSSNYDRIKISAINTGDPGKIVVVYSNPQTGEYEFQVPQGNYEVTYETPGNKKTQRDLILSLTQPSDSFNLPGIILPKTDLIANLSVENEDVISVASADTVVIPVKTEPGSMVVVEHWIGDSLVYTEKFAVSDSTFNYKMVPLTGDNKVTFKVTDRFSNTTTADVLITREKPAPIAKIIRPEYDSVSAEMSGGKTSPEEVDRITETILAKPDITISQEREKLLAIDGDTETGNILRQAITATEKKGIKDGGAWMQSVYKESIKLGMTDEKFAEVMAVISSLPVTDAEPYLRNLASVAEEPFLSWLNSLDLEQEKIKTPEDLILFILKNRDQVVPEEIIFRAIADLTASKDIPDEIISTGIKDKGEGKWWILWLLLGAGALFFFIWFLKKRKDDENESE